jgi:hypothetical protein
MSHGCRACREQQELQMLAAQNLFLQRDYGGGLIVDRSHGDQIAQCIAGDSPRAGKRALGQRGVSRRRAFQRDDAFYRSMGRAFFRAAKPHEDARDVWPADCSQRLQIPRDLLARRGERAVAQCGQAGVGGFEGHDRRFHVALEHEAALRELDQEHRFGARPGALGPAGAASDLLDDGAELL